MLRDVAEALSLETCKIRLNVALSSLIYWEVSLLTEGQGGVSNKMTIEGPFQPMQSVETLT